MSFFNPYIVFIVKTGESFQTGTTTDIDQVIDDCKNADDNCNLVFQRHFDDPAQAESFATQVKELDQKKIIALINGDFKLKEGSE